MALAFRIDSFPVRLKGGWTLTLLLGCASALGAEWTLAEAVDRVLAGAPELEASAAAVEAGTLHVRRANRWTKPTVSFEAENFGGTGAFAGTRSAEYTATVEQPLELGGQRAARTRLAQIGLDEAELGRALRTMELREEVTRRFARLLHAQATDELAEERWASIQRTASAVEAKRRSGAAAGIDRARSEVSMSLAAVERDRAKAALAQSQMFLAALWGGFEGEAVRALGALSELPPNLESDGLEASLENSPALRLARSPVEARREALRLAEASRWPEVSAVLGHRWFAEGSADAWVAGFALSLPLWDRPKDAIRLAQAERRRAEATVRMAERQLRGEVRSMAAQLAAARRAATQLSENALPRARESLALVQEGYELGRYDLLFLLEAQKTLFELRAQNLDTLLECHLAWADLDALVNLSSPRF